MYDDESIIHSILKQFQETLSSLNENFLQGIN